MSFVSSWRVAPCRKAHLRESALAQTARSETKEKLQNLIGSRLLRRMYLLNTEYRVHGLRSRARCSTKCTFGSSSPSYWTLLAWYVGLNPLGVRSPILPFLIYNISASSLWPALLLCHRLKCFNTSRDLPRLYWGLFTQMSSLLPLPQDRVPLLCRYKGLFRQKAMHLIFKL
jgi:hypothetical protein